MEALPICVYHSVVLGDCTNGGISSKYACLYLVCDEGYIEFDENNPPESFVKIVTRRTFGGRTETHIEPWKKAEGVGYMFGGNIAYSPDSRFHKISGGVPLLIYDRQETQEEYDRFSH